ncbi:hypothetical protein LFML04_0429 [Leptospirillum ferriphilum ML-04]|uniref:Uncharacterized protein n=1 Tax=Leptospirillum ferriphilum (strain ML-04) TaxID=1048260 RepID=J9Z892_LEPFM|nr:hypothetical protein LFML04_0429 [Leptospirillum ferriphilum ML-04]
MTFVPGCNPMESPTRMIGGWNTGQMISLTILPETPGFPM